MTTITVRGVGGGINFEMKVIEDALKAAGFNVIVENDAADWACSSEEGWHERVLKLNQEKPATVKLKAHHTPWGG